jgi:hypothetical protein
MTLPSGSKAAQGARPGTSYTLAVSWYDRIASLLVALLTLVGGTVLGLVIIYFTARIFARQKAVPVTLASVASAPEGAVLGLSRDLEPPGQEELPDLMEPQLQETLTAVSNAISSKIALLDDRAFEAEVMAGRGSGAGDSRQPGVGGDGAREKVPRAERWEVRFQVPSLTTYARQLDYFGIELASVGRDNKVHYAYQLAKDKPERKTGPPEAERRMYMTWRSGVLMDFDRQLLVKAGVPVTGRITLQFYPAETEQMLAGLEREYAGERDVNEIRKTIFGVQEDEDRWWFHVIEQKHF